MRYYRQIMILFIVSITLPASIVLGAGPGSGSMTQKHITVESCALFEINVKWKFGSLMGEPTVNGTYKYISKNDCRLPHTTVIWLKVDNNGSYGFVRLDPTVPKPNNRWAFNTTGSPSWSQLLCGYDGTRRLGCLNKEQAKEVWKDGKVTEFYLGW